MLKISNPGCILLVFKAATPSLLQNLLKIKDLVRIFVVIRIS